MKKIVITGGPCAGKTSMIDGIKNKYNCHVVPEAATILLSNGWPPPSSQTDINWFREFQKGTFDLQTHLENALNFKEGDLAILDRGRLDSAGYWPNGQDDYYKEFNVNVAEGFNRYDGVIFLDSLAIHQPALYSKENNPHRYDSVQDAQRITDRLFEVWVGHPRFFRINNSKSLNENLNLAIGYIDFILNNPSWHG